MLLRWQFSWCHATGWSPVTFGNCHHLKSILVVIAKNEMALGMGRAPWKESHMVTSYNAPSALFAFTWNWTCINVQIWNLPHALLQVHRCHGAASLSTLCGCAIEGCNSMTSSILQWKVSEEITVWLSLSYKKTVFPPLRLIQSIHCQSGSCG